jgi:hypothetical protein
MGDTVSARWGFGKHGNRKTVGPEDREAVRP